MGQKVNPVGLRIGIIRDWESKWYADKDYAVLLHEDLKVREYIAKRLSDLLYPKLKSNVQLTVSMYLFTLLNQEWLSVRAVLKLKHFAKL